MAPQQMERGGGAEVKKTVCVAPFSHGSLCHLFRARQAGGQRPFISDVDLEGGEGFKARTTLQRLVDYLPITQR